MFSVISVCHSVHRWILCDHCLWWHWSVTGHMGPPGHVQTCSLRTPPVPSLASPCSNLFTMKPTHLQQQLDGWHPTEMPSCHSCRYIRKVLLPLNKVIYKWDEFNEANLSSGSLWLIFTCPNLPDVHYSGSVCKVSQKAQALPYFV